MLRLPRCAAAPPAAFGGRPLPASARRARAPPRRAVLLKAAPFAGCVPAPRAAVRFVLKVCLFRAVSFVSPARFCSARVYCALAEAARVSAVFSCASASVSAFWHCSNCSARVYCFCARVSASFAAASAFRSVRILIEALPFARRAPRRFPRHAFRAAISVLSRTFRALRTAFFAAP